MSVGEPTEGDWTVGRNTRGQWCVQADQPERRLAVTPAWALGPGMTLVDATLCAAAKKMLEACKAAFEHATHDPIARLDQPQLSKLRKAIALATQPPPAELLRGPASEQSK